MAKKSKSNQEYVPKPRYSCSGAPEITRPPLRSPHFPPVSAQQPMTIEEFKQQLSRDLHDECGQVIAFLQLRLATLQTALPPEHPDLGAQVVEIAELVSKLSLKLHTLCSELRSPLFPAGGLTSGLGQLAAEIAVLRSDLQLNLNIAGMEEHWPATHQEALYHVCQEAMTNILRHAHAQRIGIDLRQEQGELLLTVSDNGDGFTLGLELSSQGLPGMRERLERLGGSLQIESRAGEGTTIKAKVPLPEAGDA
jgi:signal transduction histidine kinase